MVHPGTLSLLQAIHQSQMIGSERPFMMVEKNEAQALVDQGYALVNQSLIEGDKIATILTDEGRAAITYSNTPQETPASEWPTTPYPTQAQAPVVPAAAQPSTTPIPAGVSSIIAAVPMPTSGRAAKGEGSTRISYPIDQLLVGHSFFVAATPDRPKPAKNVASAISAFKKRQRKLGIEVDFLTKAVKDGEPWGYPNTPGAAIWRKL